MRVSARERPEPKREAVDSSAWALEIQYPVGSHERLYCGFAGGVQGAIAGVRENRNCRASKSLTAPITGAATDNVNPIAGGAWTVTYQPTGSGSTDTATLTDVWP